MKIVVLVKEVVDLNSADIESDEYLPKEFDQDEIITNPNDKHAIEAALVLKESLNDVTVHALCLGSENALKVLRESIAMGCDEASRIDADELEYLTPLAKGKILAKAIKSIGADLVLTGMYSDDMGNAQMPGILANELNLPQVTYANALTLQDTILIVDRYIEGGSITIKVSLPAVVSVASTANEPRYTSVKRILLAKKTKIPVISLEDLEIEEDELSSIGGLELVEVTEPPVEEIECYKIEEEDPDEAVDQLLTKLKEDGIDLGAYK